MGKTTLSQLIYNDERVTTHFTVRIWVCVSDLFDIERMTKEIVKTISPNYDLLCDLGVLQVQLMEMLKSRKFVLVLDDIWQITQHQWESFNKPLRNGLEGSMILVTTRHENIARLVATSNCNPVQLKGLPDSIFWEFFKKCAFDKECPDSYPHLQEIGRSISSKLCGTLAAKTLGRLLNSNLTEQHWMTIKDSELRDQEQKEGDILPALRLSYLYLPTELRRCFAFCSIFPKDYSFRRQEIVDIWVAQGFVAPLKSMCIEEVGIRCLDKLRDRCLFQADPKFPNQDRYVMHDLIHDTAQYVSKHECFSMKDLSNSGRHEFRHMSVEVDSKSLSTMENIQHLNKLRSLRFGTTLKAEITWFSQLSNILLLSLKYCKLKKLPESICELSSLRYLDISCSTVEELPAKFWCLYSLQVVDASNSSLAIIPPITTKLTNLRRLELGQKGTMALSKVRGLGNLCCLQNLSYFTVARRKGAIGELNGMNELRGTLRIRSIHTVKSREEAAEARLIDKRHLKELELNWRIKQPETSEPRPGENDVMDGLCPNQRIKSLKVKNFWGDRLPSWFNPKDLQNLRSLKLSNCPYIETLSSQDFTVGAQGCSQHASSSTNCINDITFNQPVIHRALDIMGFVHLQDMILEFCGSLMCPQQREMVLPPSLRRLEIVCCGQLDMSFPSCLENLTRLTVLSLVGCHNVESIPLDSIPCRNKLKYVQFGRCEKLSSIGGSGIPSSVGYVHVYGCRKLTQVSQEFRKSALPTQEKEEIAKFLGTIL